MSTYTHIHTHAHTHTFYGFTVPNEYAVGIEKVLSFVQPDSNMGFTDTHTSAHTRTHTHAHTHTHTHS